MIAAAKQAEVDGRRLRSAETPSPFELDRAIDGASFVSSVPHDVPAVWGTDGGAVAWAEGEPLMLVGPDGVGKTSIQQQLLLRRLGISDELFAMPVKQAAKRVLYIAADRPRQAASSLRRMVLPAHDEILRERLVVWKGPLPFDLGLEPRAFVPFVLAIGEVSDVFIDSLKDVAVDLSKDETGSRVNVAIQEVIAGGFEVVTSHHQRKAQSNGTKPTKLSDVYGSRWLTAGMGSVILLWGDPGDLVIELKHLKQPAEEIGPFKVRHDHGLGVSVVHGAFELEAAVALTPGGLLVKDAASQMFETVDPSANEIEKARRRLNGLVERNRAERREEATGTVRYFGPQKGA